MKGNGKLTAVLIATFLSGALVEVTYNLHQLQQVRERVAAIEAKVDLLLEDRRADSH